MILTTNSLEFNISLLVCVFVALQSKRFTKNGACQQSKSTLTVQLSIYLNIIPDVLKIFGANKNSKGKP